MPEAHFQPPSTEEQTRWAALPPASITIERSWDGVVTRADAARLSLEFTEWELQIAIDAPFHGGAAPAAPAGSCPKLWEHEVVELFLLGSAEQYLELEFGPHGHYLMLRLAGVRRVQAEGMLLLDYSARIEAPRWTGRARLPLSWLPPGWSHFNAYSIDGTGAQRRYWARFPVPGAQPDFHRLGCFEPFDGLAATAGGRSSDG